MAPGSDHVVPGQTDGDAAADVSAVATLDEPTRKRIYDHVRACPTPVSRDDVADALGVPRRTAAFHLDRLAEQGLLDVSFGRRSGRSGPGAGRPAKLYQRSSRVVSVSLPPRHYDLAGRLLAGAFVEVQEGGGPPSDVLDRRAHQVGRALAGGRSRAGDTENDDTENDDTKNDDTKYDDTKNDDTKERAQEDMNVLMNVLETQGYEPWVDGHDVVLHNCPFHAMAQEHTELVCGMNLHLLEGVLDVLGTTGLRARLDPGPCRCCVRLERSDVKESAARPTGT